MKRLLSIIGAISLLGTSTTSLVACNTPQEYTPEKLKELKEKNKIDTKNQQIRDNLEWIAPQEKVFSKLDNNWYYVVWRNSKNHWRKCYNILYKVLKFNTKRSWVNMSKIMEKKIINYWNLNLMNENKIFIITKN